MARKARPGIVPGGLHVLEGGRTFPSEASPPLALVSTSGQDISKDVAVRRADGTVIRLMVYLGMNDLLYCGNVAH